MGGSPVITEGKGVLNCAEGNSAGGEGHKCTIIQLAKELSRQKSSLSCQVKSKKGLELDSLKPSSQTSSQTPMA
jgi:hypothetical protein